MRFFHQTKKYSALAILKLRALCSHALFYFFQFWQTHQAKTDKFIRAMTVATTTVSTYLNAIGMVPIFLSMLPVAAGIPLMGMVLPSSPLISPMLTFLTLSISFLTGYLKYQELKNRAHLDATILNNQHKIQALGNTLRLLESRTQPGFLGIQKSQSEPSITPNYELRHQTQRSSKPLTPKSLYTLQKYPKVTCK